MSKLGKSSLSLTEAMARARQNIKTEEENIATIPAKSPKLRETQKEMLSYRKTILALARSLDSHKNERPDLEKAALQLAQYAANDVFFRASASAENQHNKINAQTMIKRAWQIEKGEYKSPKWIKGQSFELTNAIANGESSQRVHTILGRDVAPTEISRYVIDFEEISHQIKLEKESTPPSPRIIETPTTDPHSKPTPHIIPNPEPAPSFPGPKGTDPDTPDPNGEIFEKMKGEREKERKGLTGTGKVDDIIKRLEPKKPEPTPSPAKPDVGPEPTPHIIPNPEPAPSFPGPKGTDPDTPDPKEKIFEKRKEEREKEIRKLTATGKVTGIIKDLEPKKPEPTPPPLPKIPDVEPQRPPSPLPKIPDVGPEPTPSPVKPDVGPEPKPSPVKPDVPPQKPPSPQGVLKEEVKDFRGIKLRRASKRIDTGAAPDRDFGFTELIGREVRTASTSPVSRESSPPQSAKDMRASFEKSQASRGHTGNTAPGISRTPGKGHGI